MLSALVSKLPAGGNEGEATGGVCVRKKPASPPDTGTFEEEKASRQDNYYVTVPFH